MPTGVQVGLGTRVNATPSFQTQGNFQITDGPLDWAIVEGNAFFQVTMSDGTIAYTRGGSWQIDDEGQIVNEDGLLLEPAITIPQDAVDIQLSPTGIVSVRLANETELQELGQIELARFINPGGLRAVGDRLFVQTDASGDPITGNPGEDGMPQVRQKVIEMSNVEVVTEMARMIEAQRIYEGASKALMTHDEQTSKLITSFSRG